MNKLAERLTRVMGELGLEKPKDLAAYCGVSEGLVSQWFSGATKLGPKPLKALSKTQFSLDWITEGKLPKYRQDAPPGAALPGAMRVSIDAEDANSYRIQKVHLQLRAGVTGFQTVPEVRDGGTINLPKNWVDRKGFTPAALIAIGVKGDSMEPRLFEGDVVVINTADRKLVDGEVYAVNYEGEAVIKRLLRERGEWWLSSDNPDQIKHRPRGCREGDCIIIGRVVWKGSERI